MNPFKNFAARLISGLLLLIAVVLIILWLLKGCGHTAQPTAEEKPDTSTWITNGGDIVASLTGTPAAFASVPAATIDSIARVYRARSASDVQEYIIAYQRAHADVPAVPGTGQVEHYTMAGAADSSGHCPPQVARMRARFASPYYQAEAQLGDSAYLHLVSLDTLTAVWKTVRNGGLFNRRILLQLDLSSANPDSRIYGLQAYRQVVPVKRWSIGPQAGATLVAGKVRPFVGVGITYSVINF